MSSIRDIKLKKQELTEKAIRDGGFYGKNGVWNSIITFPGDRKIYRERVETIIVRNSKEVFVKKKVNGDYFLPGGSTERDISHIDQAINECREEAHINIRNIMSTGLSYKTNHEVPKCIKNDEYEVEWQGTYTEIYVADFDSMFHGHVDSVDEDPFIKSGKWYTTKECFKMFRKEHRDALLWYIKHHEEKECGINNVTESYVGNYFRNKKLLKKISHTPDVEKAAIEQCIATITKEYHKLAEKSKIKRLRRQSDVSEYFFPIMSFEFSDGCNTTIALSFDDSSITDGCAMNTDEYGYVIVIYPCFFKTTKDNQIFTILHEMGHIRLKHVDRSNIKTDIFGNDITSEHRTKTMTKNKVTYPEVNADLYAVLNGASMYTILDSNINNDYDSTYDYRFTNLELANRYSSVMRKYGKLRGYVVESDDMSAYDIACNIIYETVYNNENLSFLNDRSKSDLYQIMYHYGIIKRLPVSSDLIALTESYNECMNIYNEKLEEYHNLLEKSKENIVIESEIFGELNEKVIPLGTLNINKEEKKLSEYRTNVNNAYDKLIKERSYLFNNLCEQKILGLYNRGVIINPTKINIYISKSILNNIIDILELVLDKLKKKREITNNDDLNHMIFIIESLTKSERDKIPTSSFGIPDMRLYPLDTKKHVRSAIKLFSRAPENHKEELAKNIKNAMNTFGINMSEISDNAEFIKYL